MAHLVKGGFIIKIIEKILEILGIFSDIENGKITLATGSHELFIKTCFQPTDIWLSCCEENSHQVCGSNPVTKFGYQIKNKGFKLWIDVFTSSVTLNWIAIKK